MLVERDVISIKIGELYLKLIELELVGQLEMWTTHTQL
jgi:hypothetical protein